MIRNETIIKAIIKSSNEKFDITFKLSSVSMNPPMTETIYSRQSTIQHTLPIEL